MNTIYCLLLLASLATAQSQDCLLSQDRYYVPRIKAGETQRCTLRVQNASTFPLIIHSTEFINAYLYNSVIVGFSKPSLTIAPFQYENIEFDVTPRHNVPINGRILFTIQCEQCTLTYHSVALSSSGDAMVYSDSSIYSFTNNLEYDTLYTALRQTVVNHTSLGYKNAREVMFGKADNVNDSVECIYTGRKLKTAGIPPNGEFNTEHTWVQSRGSSEEPNKSDINHLYPTYPNANTIRANYPFGVVAKLWRDAGGGSRLGFTPAGDTVFEPRNGSKGNIARSIFYYMIRYGNLTNYYTQPYNMDATLRAWNMMDPPDAHELTRCDTIAKYQGKRNPVIDHPEFVERIDFIPSEHPEAVRFVQRRFVFDTTNFVGVDAHIVNRWNRKVLVTKVEFVPPDYFNGNLHSSDSIDEHSFETLVIRHYNFRNMPARTYCILSFSNGGRDTLLLDNCLFSDVLSALPQAQTLRVSPHPVEDHSVVECAVQKSDVIRVVLYNIDGKEIADLSQSISATAEGITFSLSREYTHVQSRTLILRLYTLHGVIEKVIVMP